MLEKLIEGFIALLSFWSVVAALCGLVGGVIVGALPGLTATMAVAVLTPVTFFMPLEIALPFLLAVYKGAIYGGSIPAILINTPGTAAAAAMTMDGHALAQKGMARKALEMSLYAVVVGDLLATIVLITVAAPLAAVALKFSSPDFTMLYAFSLTMIAAVSGSSMVKGLISAAIGVLLACIGLDPMSGLERFTFGVVDLMGGVSLVPLLIGMFALSEILIQAETGGGKGKLTADPTSGAGVTFSEFRKVFVSILRGTGIGAFLGALPGLGAEISCWISYGIAKKRSRHPEEYGQGSLEGVAAAESGANAVCPAALIPMLVFGIPGDTVTAVLLGAFMAQGLLPGPLLFVNHSEVLYGLFAFLLLTNVTLLVLGYGAIRYVVKIILIPKAVLLPIVATLCFAGSFAVNSSYFDVLVTVLGGFAGYVMRKTGVPVPPLVIALLLAPGFENALRQSLMFSDNSLIIFLTRPISAAIFALLVLVLAFSVWSGVRKKRTA
jgi:putative tricarboxylic transport membrane protein